MLSTASLDIDTPLRALRSMSSVSCVAALLAADKESRRGEQFYTLFGYCHGEFSSLSRIFPPCTDYALPRYLKYGRWGEIFVILLLLFVRYYC
jgi:hypothetical protein